MFIKDISNENGFSLSSGRRPQWLVWEREEVGFNFLTEKLSCVLWDFPVTDCVSLTLAQQQMNNQKTHKQDIIQQIQIAK